MTRRIDGPASREPEPRRRISDVETLRALSDPLRLRILEAMVSRTETPWTVKELARALDVPQTRLYHHLELLVERDLVRVVGERVVSGIIERRYRVAALSFELDRALLASGAAGESASRELLATVFDSTRQDLERLLAMGSSFVEPGQREPTVLSRGLAHLTPERAAEFRDRLAALFAEFDADAPGDDRSAYGLLLAFYRMPPKEASR
jgi:DNA-binding transcriptional ArsR family regulator